MVPVIAFIGRHNSGKTTLLTKIINLLDNQGLKVGVIKGARQKLELPSNKDGEKLFNAGASVVYTSGLDIQIAYWRDKTPLSELIKAMEKDVDLIIIEGFKETSYPKIEVLREEISTDFLNTTNVVARVLDFNPNFSSEARLFSFDEVEELSLFILKFIEEYTK